MSRTPSAFNVLVLSGDPDIQNQLKHAFKDASVTAAKSASSLPKDMTRRIFDAVIVELKPGSSGATTAIPTNIDHAHTLVITGSRSVLKRASKFMQVLARQNAAGANRKRGSIPGGLSRMEDGRFREGDARRIGTEPASHADYRH